MSEEKLPYRSNFRLVDLVVVLLILFLAVGILLPALGSLRQRHIPAKCMNNIRQLALGCHNCIDAVGSMPPYRSGIGHGLPTDSYFAKPGNEGSVFFFLLPFVEEKLLFDTAAIGSPLGVAYNLYATEPAPSNSSRSTGLVTTPPTPPFVGQNAIRLLQCPMDVRPLAGFQLSADVRGDGLFQTFGACSYACNYLVFGNIHAIKNGELNNPDRFQPFASVPVHAPSHAPKCPDSFPDGTSTTLLFAEKLPQCGWTMGNTSQSLPAGNLWAPAGDNARYAPAFAMEAPWHDGTTFQVQPSLSRCNVAYPSTMHEDGLVVAMADGSGKFLHPRISSATFYALCTPNGSEPIADDY